MGVLGGRDVALITIVFGIVYFVWIHAIHARHVCRQRCNEEQGGWIDAVAVGKSRGCRCAHYSALCAFLRLASVLFQTRLLPRDATMIYIVLTLAFSTLFLFATYLTTVFKPLIDNVTFLSTCDDALLIRLPFTRLLDCSKHLIQHNSHKNRIVILDEQLVTRRVQVRICSENHPHTPLATWI